MKIFEEHTDHVSLDSIRKYLNDQMSHEEMHVFERHLLDCEFCNTAYEGYQLSPKSTINDSQDTLKNRLEKRVGVKKAPKMTIAASVIFLLCFSIVLTFSVWENQEDEISMVKRAEKETTEESIVQPDVPEQSAEVAEKSNPEVELKPDQKIMAGVGEKKPVIGQKRKSIPQKTVLPTTNLAKDEISESDSDLFAASDEALEEREEIIVEEEIVFGFEEDAGAFDLVKNDNVIRERKIIDPTNKAFGSKSRVLLPSIKKSKVLRLSSKIKSEDGQGLFQNAQPIGGFDQYKLYLKDSLRYPEKAKANNIEGEVKLLFQVTETGIIENLEIIKSLFEACDLEAKRLVLEGQKWTLIDNTLSKENNIVNLTIQFNLSD